jgi:hypothetical protein
VCKKNKQGEREMNGIRTEVKTITPRIARNILEKNHLNTRKLSIGKVNTYKNAMLEEEWEFNGIPLLFTENNDLLDGQHRLNALILADKTLSFTCVKGVDRKVFHTIDRGYTRTTGQVLAIEHPEINNPNIIAAAISFVERFTGDEKFTTAKSPTPNKVLNFLEKNPEIQDGEKYTIPLNNLLPSSIVVGMYYLLNKKDSVLGKEIFDKLINKEPYISTEPVAVFLKELHELAQYEKRNRDMQKRYVASLINTWNCYKKNNLNPSIKSIRYYTTKKFPIAL